MAPVEAGNLLFEEKIFALAVAPDFFSKRCDQCFAKENLRKCDRCKTISYCSKECQKDAWIVHKGECSKDGKFKSHSMHGRLLAKVLMRLKAGDDKVYYTKNKFKSFYDMEGLPMPPVTCLALKDAIEIIGSENLKGLNLQMIISKVLSNVGTLVSENSKEAINLSVVESTLKRSCSPNVNISYCGQKVEYRAMNNLSDLTWEKVEIPTPNNEMSLMNPTMDVMHLFNCEDCSDIEKTETKYGIICPNQKCKNPVYLKVTDPFISVGNHCRHCHQPIPASVVRRYVTVSNHLSMLNNEISKEGGSFPPMEELQSCINMQEGLLHPLNLLRKTTMMMLLQKYIEHLEVPEIEKYFYSILTTVKKHLGEFTPKVYQIMMLVNVEMYKREQYYRAAKINEMLAKIQYAMSKRVQLE